MATSPATDLHSPTPVDGILLAEELLDLAERAQAYTNAAGVAIALRRGQDLVVRTSTGAAPEVGAIIPMSDAFIADCLRSRRPLCCRDSESDNRVGPVFRAMKTRSLIAIPICEHRDAKGVMIVIAPVPNAFQPTHTAILLTLSDIIASKLAARDAMPKVDSELSSLTDLAPEPTTQPIIAAPVAKPAPPVAPPAVTKLVIAPAPVAKPLTAAAAASASAMPAPKPVAHAVPFREVAKPIAPEPAATPAPASAVVPPALLREAALPLPVEKMEAAPDPGLLSPSEDPTRFKPVCPISSSTTVSPRADFMSITLKPVATSAATPAIPAPAAEVKPAISLAKPAAAEAKPVIAEIKISEVGRAISAWEAPAAQTSQRPMLMGAAAVGAALVLIAGLWMYHSATKEVAAPTAAPMPSPAATTLPVAAAPATMTVEVENAAKPATTKPEQAKTSTPAEATAVDSTRHVAPKVMEIAPAKPKDVEADLQAPKLALASNDAALSSLSKLPVAVPTRLKSELVPASLVSRVPPVFPPLARQLRVYGTVVMDITIAPNGTVSEVHVVSGENQLREAAVAAVKQWRYKPALLNGAPTESTASVQINFTR